MLLWDNKIVTAASSSYSTSTVSVKFHGRTFVVVVFMLLFKIGGGIHMVVLVVVVVTVFS